VEKKVSAGQKLTKPSAGFHNDLVDLVNRKHQGGEKPQQPKHTPRNYCKVKARNSSGGAVRRGEVLEFTAEPLTTKEPDYPWFTGSLNSGSYAGWGITKSPIPSGDIDDVICVGVCIAYVTVLDVDHKFADRAAGSLTLVSAQTGPVKIITPLSGTGEQECWVQLMDASGGLEPIRFELTGTLALSGHAPAKLMIPDGSGGWTAADPVVELEVYDPYGSEGMWNGVSGYQGWAFTRNQTYTDTAPDPDEVRPAYDIIWMERIAQEIQFTTTEYMGQSTAGRVAVTVDWYDGQGVDPGSVIARDIAGQFPDVPSGAKGTAVYDNHNGYYRIVSCQRVVRIAKMLLNGACCATSTATVDGFVGRPQGDDVLDPPTVPTTVNNPRAHAGIDNDEVLVVRINNTVNSLTWEIFDIDLHAVDVITTVEISGGNLQFKTKTTYVEQCSTAESSPTTIAATTTCP